MMTFRYPDHPTRRTVVVAGDALLDTHHLTKSSPGEVGEGVPSYSFEEGTHHPGWAAAVAGNLARAGLRCDLVCPHAEADVGDPCWYELVRLLGALHDRVRFSTSRGSHLVHLHSLYATGFHVPNHCHFFVDGRRTLCETVGRKVASCNKQHSDWLVSRPEIKEAHAVVLVNRSRGGMTVDAIAAYTVAAKNLKIPVVLDSDGTDWNHWTFTDLVIVGEKDLWAAYRERSDPRVRNISLEVIMAGWQDLTQFKHLVVLCEDGSLLYHDGLSHTSIREPSAFLPWADRKGSREVAVAVLAGGLVTGYGLPYLASVASLARGLFAYGDKAGTLDAFALHRALCHRDFRNKFGTTAQLEDWGKYAYRADKKVVFVSGSFDMFHAGHLHLLEKCREYGDALVVSLTDDAGAANKGEGRPVLNLQARQQLVGALPWVDVLVTHTFKDSLLDNVKAVRPTAIVTGEEYKNRQVVGADWVAERGGQVIFLPRYGEADGSTEAIIEKVRGVKVGS